MPLIIVASHHKAGSTYAKKCFSEIAFVLGYDYHFYGYGETPDPIITSQAKNKILCFSHACIETIAEIITRQAPEAFRLVHFIRDPRTLIVSATKYHSNADEHWLSIPKSEYGGKSYQQYITGLACYSDQLIFEMNNGSHEALQEMGNIYTSKLATITIKLEEISWDASGFMHHKLSEHLVDDTSMQSAVKTILMKNSLFALPSTPRHARTMLSCNTRNDLQDYALISYCKLYGHLHSILGYKT